MSKILSRWKRPLIRTKIFSGLARYPKYFLDWRRYRKMESAEPIKLRDTYPCLFDKKSKTRIDSHYFYQDIWAFKKINQLRPKRHVDVGSNVNFVGFLTAITKVHFVDIRPLDAPYLTNIENIKGSILELPYQSNSLESVSCLNVAEHIGLGRYGDRLDPFGTKKSRSRTGEVSGEGWQPLFFITGRQAPTLF